MGIIKRTFSIPEEVSEALDNSIPSQEKSRFVSSTLAKALKEQNKQKLLQSLGEIEPFPEQEESSVDMIRRIRTQFSPKHSA